MDENESQRTRTEDNLGVSRAPEHFRIQDSGLRGIAKCPIYHTSDRLD